MPPAPTTRRLSELLRGGALPPAAALEFGVGLGVALQRAQAADAAAPHAAVREIEPDTIVLTEDGSVPVDDLGLSMDLGGSGGLKSSAYEAPEVLAGFGASDAAHVFSAGAVLYEAFLGDPLFFSADLAGARRSIAQGLARTLARRDVQGRLDSVVPGLGAVVLRCLAEEPADRYPGGSALAAELTRLRAGLDEPPFALERFLLDRPVSARPPSAAVTDAPEPPAFLSGLSGLHVSTSPGISSEEFEKALASNAAIPVAHGGPEETNSGSIRRDGGPSVAVDFELEERRRVVEQPLLSLEARTRKEPVAPPQRLTPKPLYKEEGFAGAFRWFLVRVAIWGGLPATLLAAWAYFGATPAVTNAQASRLWDALPPDVTRAVPAERQEALAAWWSERPHGQLLQPVGDIVLGLLPEAWVAAATAGPEQPEVPTSPGTPTPEGIVTEANGWVGGGFEPPAGLGALKLDLDQGGFSVSPEVALVVTPRGGASAAARAAAEGDATAAPTGPRTAEGPASEAYFLEPGLYDVALTYAPGGDGGEHAGAIRNLRVNADHTTRVHGVLSTPVGFVQLHFGSEEAERSEHVTVSGYAGEAVAWSGPAGQRLPVPAGTFRVVARLDDGVHRPTELVLKDFEVGGDGAKVEQRHELPLGEHLNPTGPGLRVEVFNLGTDVSERSQVLLYQEGVNPERAPAMHRGRGAFYFDAEPGAYDLRVVFEPSAKVLDLRGEAIVQSIEVAPEGVSRLKVDVELPFATVDVAAVLGDRDASDRVRVVLTNPGAQFEGSRRAADFQAGEPMPVPVGTWDVHVLGRGPAGERHETFESVSLRHGRVWTKRFDLGTADWTPAK